MVPSPFIVYLGMSSASIVYQYEISGWGNGHAVDQQVRDHLSIEKSLEAGIQKSGDFHRYTDYNGGFTQERCSGQCLFYQVFHPVCTQGLYQGTCPGSSICPQEDHVEHREESPGGDTVFLC